MDVCENVIVKKKLRISFKVKKFILYIIFQILYCNKFVQDECIIIGERIYICYYLYFVSRFLRKL